MKVTGTQFFVLSGAFTFTHIGTAGSDWVLLLLLDDAGTKVILEGHSALRVLDMGCFLYPTSGA